MRSATSAVALTLLLALAYCHSGAKINAQVINESCEVDADGEAICSSGSTARSLKIDITCDALEDNQINWDCIFGPESLKKSLEEIADRGGIFETCPTASRTEPCQRFIVTKENERAEMKVVDGHASFPFLKNERYVFKYSFRAVKGMQVTSRFTHLGQLKGSVGGYMIKGDPIYSLTANNKGLMVRFSNKESIDDYVPGMEEFLPWEDATGEWVHVEIVTVFGKSMEVFISGAVNGHAVWPQDLEPVAWHRDAEMVRMKLGLYHSAGNVADGEVEYKNISIEGPNGIIRTSPEATPPRGAHMMGCFKDNRNDRVFGVKWVDLEMTAEKCAGYCNGSTYFATQFGVECWCGNGNTVINKHGAATCDIVCPGAKHQPCGGYLAMNVYKNGGEPSNTPTNSKYLGCFKDKYGDRALTYGSPRVSTNGMTYENCRGYCGGKGQATHMGLQYGRECFCGNADDDFSKHGEAICQMPCSGNADHTCGGGHAMSVFKID